MVPLEKLKDRFLSKLDALDQTPDGCVLWDEKDGRMFYRAKGKPQAVRVRRIAYLAYHGSIPEGLYVYLRCDNPLCCAKQHMYLSTKAEVSRFTRGEKNSSAVLSDHEVKEMRQQYAKGYALKKIAEEYGVTYGYAWKLVTNRVRVHSTQEFV